MPPTAHDDDDFKIDSPPVGITRRAPARDRHHVRSATRPRGGAEKSPRFRQGSRHRRQLRGGPDGWVQAPSHGFESRLARVVEAAPGWIRTLPMRSTVDDGDESHEHGASWRVFLFGVYASSFARVLGRVARGGAVKSTRARGSASSRCDVDLGNALDARARVGVCGRVGVCACVGFMHRASRVRASTRGGGRGCANGCARD
jgi:hypothetical protein